MRSLFNILNKININGKIIYNALLKDFSSFKIGGPADAYAVPEDIESVLAILETAGKHEIPLFVIGGGANILFSDSGFSGIILDLSFFNSIEIDLDTRLAKAGAGAEISLLAETAAQNSLSGLQNFYGMPGSTGGSIYMNARCFSVSVSDTLEKVSYIDEDLKIKEYHAKPQDFAYKVSPFRDKKQIIIKAEFKLDYSSSDKLKEEMQSYKEERKSKGHYLYPCAGSVFKNNRDFGKPSGAIIDSLGMRGLKLGGAMVSPCHANIIVNSENASSEDVKNLVSIIEEKVFKEYGFRLEKEILYIE